MKKLAMVSKQSLRTKALSWVLVGALMGSGVPPALAEHGEVPPPDSTIPVYDPFDLERYEALHQRALQQLRLAEGYLAAMTAEANRDRVELVRAAKVIDALNEKQVAQTTQIIALQASIKAAREAIQKADLDITSAQTALAQLKPSATAEATKLAQLKAQFAQLNQRAQAASATADANSKAAQAARADATVKSKAVTQLSAEQVKLTHQAATLQTKADELATQVTQLKELATNGQQLVEKQAAEVARVAQVLVATKAKENAARAAFQAIEKAFKETPPANQAQRLALKRKMDAAAKVLEQDEAITARVEQTKVAADRKLAQLKKQVDDSKTQLPAREAELAQAKSAATAAKARAAELNAPIQQASRDFQAADTKAKLLEGQAAPFLAAARQARLEADAAGASVKASESTLQDLNKRISAREASLTQLQQAKVRQAAAMDQATAGIGSARAELANLKNQIEAQTPALNRAQAAAQQANQRQARAERIVHSHRVYTAQIEKRVDEVRRERHAAIAQARFEGQQDGAQHGAIEGTRAGRERGEIEGRENGGREGYDAGVRDGVAAARSAGAQQGTAEARAQGNAQGSEQGRAEGEAQGRSTGRKDGLAQGYKLGYDQGWQAGKTAGDAAGKLMGGFEKGQVDGYVEGKARAQSAATLNGGADGSKRADQEARAVQLTDTTLPNRELTPSSAVMGNRDWHNGPGWRPHRPYPHPLVKAAYLDAYERAFNFEAARQFETVYNGTFEAARVAAYRSAYDAAFAGDYRQQSEAARGQAFQAAYEPARAAAHQREFNRAYPGFYEIARKAALPERKEEGLSAGQKEGFDFQKNATYATEIQRGNDEARPRAYNEHIGAMTDAARAKAYEERVKFYAENAVLQVEGVAVRDANDDDVFAPGEKASLTVTIQNFGKVATTRPVTVELALLTGSVQLEIPNDQLVPIPAQSRAWVTIVAPMQILKNAKEGEAVSLKAIVKSDGAILAEQELNFKVTRPYAVTEVALAPNVAAGAVATGTLTVKNRSSKVSSLPISIKVESTDGLSQVLSPAAELGLLQAGQAQKSEFSFTLDPKDAFKELSFRASIYEGGNLVASKSFTTQSSKKWSYDSSAKGLVVVTSREAGSLSLAALKLLEEKYDIWDEQIDGALKSEVALQYLEKGIVIPQADSAIESGTAVAVEAFLKKGGDVLAGGGGNSSAVAKVLLRAAESYPPRTDFDGLAVHEANSFRGKKYPAQVVFISRPASSLSAEELAQAIHGFELITASIAEKSVAYLRAVKASTAMPKAKRAANAILREIGKELADDEENKSKNFQESPQSTRLAAFVSFASARTGDDRLTLQGLVPEIKQIIDGGPGLLRRMAARKILKPLER